MENARGSGQGVRGWPGSKHTPALRPQSGRSARAGEDELSGAARLSPGRRPPAPRSPGTPTPEPPWARPLRALQPAPSLSGSRLRACGAARPPPRPAERLAGTQPQPMPCALLLFGGAKRNVYSLHVFSLPVAPTLFREVLDADVWVDTLYAPPALGGDPCSRS